MPGGTYELKARYGGDATFGPSESDPVRVTVSPEPSRTTLSVLTADSNGLPVLVATSEYGTFVYLRADVTSQSGYGRPTGRLLFTEAGQLVSDGIQYLNSEGNTSTPHGIYNFVAGPHSLVANYEGDLSFNVSNSPVANFTITKAITSASTSVSSVSIPHGTAVTLTTRIDSKSRGTFPAGNVTFFYKTTSLGEAGLVGGRDGQSGAAYGVATLTTIQLPSGQQSVTAQYSGDANYKSSSSNAASIKVLPNFEVSVDQPTVTIATAGQSATVTLTVVGEPEFTGTIRFSPTSCENLPWQSSCSFNPTVISGTGSTTVTITTTGPHTVVASAITPTLYLSWAFVGASLVTGVVVAGSFRRSATTLLALVVIGVTLTSTSCGGNGGDKGTGGGVKTDPGTPPGAYIVGIKAVAGSIEHTAEFTLAIAPTS